MQPLNAAMAVQEHEEKMEGEDDCGCLDLLTFTQWVQECQDQPDWRMKADRECDYYDGNQLDSDVMRKAKERGLPPAIEPLIGPTIDSVLGMEAKTRTDWRVIPDSDKQSDDVADALNYRLNQAERPASKIRSSIPIVARTFIATKSGGTGRRGRICPMRVT